MISFDDVIAPGNLRDTIRALVGMEGDVGVAMGKLAQMFDGPTPPVPHPTLYPLLYHLASHFRPARYLEIGVWRGFSAVMVASGHPAVDIVGIDNWLHPTSFTPERVSAIVKANGHTGRLQLLSGDSEGLVTPELGRFGLILVDGSHMPEVMTADLANCAPLLEPGGFILLHDVFGVPFIPKVSPGRIESWRAFQRAHPGWEWGDVAGPPGIGVGRKPS